MRWLLVLYLFNSTTVIEGGLYLHQQECKEAGISAMIEGVDSGPGSGYTKFRVEGWVCVPTKR